MERVLGQRDFWKDKIPLGEAKRESDKNPDWIGVF